MRVAADEQTSAEELRQLVVVCGEDDSRALCAYAVQQSHDQACALGVEVGRGLVGNEQLGAVQHGARYADALLLASRELVGHVVSLVLHAHHLEHLCDALLAFRLALPSRGLQHEVEVAGYGAVAQQLEVLEDDAQSLAQCGQLAWLGLAHVGVQHEGCAVANGQFAVDALEE